MIYDYEKLSFQIFTVGEYEHTCGHYAVAGRSFASLGFRLCGSGKFKIKNEEFISEAGDILFIAENENYEVDYDDGKSIVIHLTDCNYKKSENIRVKNNQLIKMMFFDIYQNYGNIGKFNHIKSQVYSIFQTINDMLVHDVMDSIVESCTMYINENFQRSDLSLDEICRAGSTSHATLLRKFHDCYGMSVKQYLLKKRIEKVLRLLAEGEKNITQISQCCGFDDPKYMSKVIKRSFGKSPRELKNSMRR